MSREIEGLSECDIRIKRWSTVVMVLFAIAGGLYSAIVGGEAFKMLYAIPLFMAAAIIHWLPQLVSLLDRLFP